MAAGVNTLQMPQKAGDKAEAKVKEAEAKVEKAEAKVKEAEAKVEKAEAKLKKAKKTKDADEINNAKHSVKAAQQALDAAHQALSYYTSLLTSLGAGPSLASGIVWAEDPAATDYMQELLRMAPERVPVGGPGEDGCGCLEVFATRTTLQEDENESPGLVVPPSTAGLWKAVHKAILEATPLAGGPKKTRSRFVVLGTPGIGKSRTINYFLRLLLATRDSTQPLPTVVFEQRKDGRVWRFAPDPEHPATVKALWCEINDFRAPKEQALDVATNVYIVDTGAAEESTMPALVTAATILVCSPDRRHYSEFQKHCAAPFYVPMWRPEDILAAAPFLTQPSDPIMDPPIRERLATVGPIPRRVFADRKTYRRFVDNIQNTFRRHSEDVEIVLAEGPGAIDAHDGHSDSKPRSAVFGYGVVGDDFRDPTVQFVSEFARLQLGWTTVKAIFFTILTNPNPAVQAELGHCFERLAVRVMARGMQMKTEEFQKTTSGMTSGTTTEVAIKRCPAIDVSSHDQMYAAMLKLPEWNGDLTQRQTVGALHTRCGNFPLLDAADGKNRGFNFTVSAKHKLPTANMVKSFRSELRLASHTPFHLIYVVPPHVYPSFQPAGLAAFLNGTPYTKHPSTAALRIYKACFDIAEKDIEDCWG
eukprot:NODE_466_length_2193_cov_48.106486_g430_i0.p1 GENE.NODE_466_length_2193_cov_48.106486_g430_i0~~NODE_466_length_2193_cov_48.106486_g430_i0.p1  ORF type:complete len:645 (-),score=141.67 NODE_466_length_2193_cov_48.106486_g430_i0:115-2049(-)